MKKEWKETASFICIVVVVVAAILILNPAEDFQRQIERFRVKAEEELGTSDFRIHQWGDLLVAVTSDGREYPSSQQWDEYYMGKIRGWGILGLFLALLCVICSLAVVVEKRKCPVVVS